MVNKYDVIIIGAGPGGLECANQLKHSGLSVLLIEKNKVIGLKVCAGGLTTLVGDFDIPKDKTRSFQENDVFIGKKPYLIKLVNSLKTISRLDLGQYQLSKIRNCENIKVMTDVSVIEIEKDFIKTSVGDFYFRYLVGADGSTSIVRRYLGLETKINIGMYYNVNKIIDRFSWHMAHRQLKSGYLWIFPHINFTNVGAFFNPQEVSPANARAALEEFLNFNKYNFTDCKFEAAPISYLYKGCVFENLFLIGDAAGLASKISGEGISFALISGAEIGKKILNHKYSMSKLNKILVVKRRQERLLKLFVIFPFLQLTLYKIFVYLMKKKWFQVYFGN